MLFTLSACVLQCKQNANMFLYSPFYYFESGTSGQKFEIIKHLLDQKYIRIVKYCYNLK